MVARPGVGFPVAVLGTGSVPGSTTVTSAALDLLHRRAPGATQSRSGVVSRFWAGQGETSSSLAAAAIQRALKAADRDACELDAILVASVLPEQPMPTTAALVAERLGRTDGGLTAFDINASCMGFLAALDLAGLAIAAGRWRTVAVAAVDIASPGLDHRDLESSSLSATVPPPASSGRAGATPESLPAGRRPTLPVRGCARSLPAARAGTRPSHRPARGTTCFA